MDINRSRKRLRKKDGCKRMGFIHANGRASFQLSGTGTWRNDGKGEALGTQN